MVLLWWGIRLGLGKMGRMGKMSKMGRMGKMSKMGRIGKMGFRITDNSKMSRMGKMSFYYNKHCNSLGKDYSYLDI